MKIDDITPVQAASGRWYKRDDLGCCAGPGFPGGVKVRAWLALAALKPGSPLVVGCAANSTAQIAAAAAAGILGVECFIFSAARQKLTEAQEYAVGIGAKVTWVRPGYLGVCQARAAEYAKGLGGAAVTWDTRMVARLSQAQCKDIPPTALRVVVPTGAGATAAGIAAGLAGRKTKVVAMAVSTVAKAEWIRALAEQLVSPGSALPEVEVVAVPGKYDDWAAAKLPGGKPLDPFYGAKALPFVGLGDCLWVPGVRPLEAFPVGARRQLGI